MFESIEQLSNHFSLLSICKALNVNRSSYLYWLNTEKNNKFVLSNFYCSLLKVYSDFNGIYGSPRITIILNRDGILCSQSKVAKAMHLLGIRSIVSKRFPQKNLELLIKKNL